MTSITNPHPEPPPNEELVAYLDGELAPAECRAVEERLANDAAYRQQLRELDQAWEALDALPPATVDDSFARTTIELACVAAEQDLTKQKSLADVHARTQKRWWIAAGVAAAVVGFVMVRALAVYRNNGLLSDLPGITQVNALTHVPDIEFLRRLSTTVSRDELVSDKAAYDRTLHDFAKANSPRIIDRQEWVTSLSPEQKADLADRTQAFEALRQDPAEKDRLRQLANDISWAKDAAKLQETLVAYGQWLSRHSAGEQEQLNDQMSELSTDGKVEVVAQMVRRDDEQAARHLSPEDSRKLREEILKFAQAKRPELLGRLPQGRERDLITNEEIGPFRQALVVLHAVGRDESDEIIDHVISKLSPEANAQWQRVSRERRDLRRFQLWRWIQDALQPTWGPKDLEQFFVSNKLSNDKRQQLLEMDRPRMETELERLYLSSELGIEDRLQFLRELGDGRRGPRGPQGGPPANDGRPGEGPRRRQEAPPRGERSGPGRANDDFERELFRGPGRPRRPGADGGPDGLPPGGLRRPPGDGPPPRRQPPQDEEPN